VTYLKSHTWREAAPTAQHQKRDHIIKEFKKKKKRKKTIKKVKANLVSAGCSLSDKGMFQVK